MDLAPFPTVVADAPPPLDEADLFAACLVQRFTVGGRSPPGPTDYRVLAFAQIRTIVVATDDLGMHELAREFGIEVWHGFELLAKLRTARAVSDLLVRDIFEALEANGDLPATWRQAKHTTFKKVFGPKA